MAKPVSLAITGASGAKYGLRLLEMLLSRQIPVYLMISSPARVVLATETELKLPSGSKDTASYLCNLFNADPGLLTVFSKEQWLAPVASGSNPPRAMVVCPCSTATLSAIATGASRSLIERAADVMLKEQKKLIVVPRETPLSAVHLENMLKLSRLGVTILPASPGFYHQPQCIDDLINHIVARILDHLDVDHDLIKRWGARDE